MYLSSDSKNTRSLMNPSDTVLPCPLRKPMRLEQSDVHSAVLTILGQWLNNNTQ